MDVSAVSLPAFLLYASVNISFSHCPFPISTPSCLLLVPSLPHFSSVSLSCSFNGPIYYIRMQPRASLSVPLPTPLHPLLPPLRLSAVDGNQVQSKPCSSPKNNSGTMEAQDRTSLYFKRHPGLLGENDFSWFIYKLWGWGVTCIQTEQLAGDGFSWGPTWASARTSSQSQGQAVFRRRLHSHHRIDLSSPSALRQTEAG